MRFVFVDLLVLLFLTNDAKAAVNKNVTLLYPFNVLKSLEHYVLLLWLTPVNYISTHVLPLPKKTAIPQYYLEGTAGKRKFSSNLPSSLFSSNFPLRLEQNM